MTFGLFIVGQRGKFLVEQLGAMDKKPSFVLSYPDGKVHDASFEGIAAWCDAHAIPFYQLKDHPSIDPLLERVEKVFVVGWQFLIKSQLTKFVVIHDSYLPEYKGWAPTVNYLIEGSPYLAATAFEPTEQMDTGAIYAQKKVEIGYPINIQEALAKVSQLYLELVLDVLAGAAKREMTGKESFCLWRDNDDYTIRWQWNAERIRRFVDAVGFPYDGAKIRYEDETVRVVEAAELPDCVIVDREAHVGKILRLDDGMPVVVCGSGLLRIGKAEKLDGTRMTFKKLKVRL
jgi:methionyl-tRNA formyltransferase